MKKLNLLIATALFVSISFFTSCGTDTEQGTPVINFVTGTGFTSADVTVKAGEALKFGITATSDVNTASKLVRFKVIRTFNNIPFTALDSTISTSSFNITITANAYPEAGSERWTFEITDKDGQSANVYLNVTTTAGGPIISYTQKILGSYDNAIYGSSFASSTGTVYTLPDAKANAAKIDWMYYYGSVNKATLAAPSDETAAQIYSNDNGPAKWSVKNATKFAKISLPTGVTWDGITNDAEIITLSSAATETKANTLVTGQIIAFKTAAGKMGIIKVTNITGTEAGSITYDVKVQQ